MSTKSMVVSLSLSRSRFSYGYSNSADTPQAYYTIRISNWYYIGASSSTPEELRKKLQQVLTVLLSSGDEECPICLDTLNMPVITHCAHLYCRPCIESMLFVFV